MEGFVHYNNYYDLIRLSSYLAEPCGPCDLLTTRNAGSRMGKVHQMFRVLKITPQNAGNGISETLTPGPNPL